MQEVLTARLRFSVLFRHIEQKLENRIKIIMQLAYLEAGKKKDKVKIVCKPPPKDPDEVATYEPNAPPKKAPYKGKGKPFKGPKKPVKEQ